MKKVLSLVFAASLMLAGCAGQASDSGFSAGYSTDRATGPAAGNVAGEDATPGGASQPANKTVSAGSGASVSGANLFNPYMNQNLPNLRQTAPQGAELLGKLGGGRQSIQGEAAHRPAWRKELYPVVFGSPTAPHEIMVLLDFSAPESAKAWHEVVTASRSLSPNACKIVVFGNSRETYGTDLMGLGIWLAQARPAQAMPWFSYALERWNSVKAAQRAAGKTRQFRHEYDTTVNPGDYPIHYSYLLKLNPPVPEDKELDIVRYSYDAGNVNMYQTVQITGYYGIGRLPAIIADGKVLSQATSSAILAAIR